MRRLTAFTVCLWMSSSSPQGTLVSYAVGKGNGNDNELIIEYNRYFDFVIGGTQRRKTSVTANDGAWHHICLSWQSSSGSWKFYKDGILRQNGTFRTGYTIRQDGTLALGQEQDSVGGDFDKSQSFQGMLSNVHVWDRVLPAKQIEEISTSCVLDEWNEANVYEWSDFLRQGGAMLRKPSPCKPFATTDYAFHFPDKGVNDVVKISDMDSLTAFTACFWMNSSSTQGTILSYAVGKGNNNDNELLIEYNGSFDFLIGGKKSQTTVTANDGVWHHICVSWESSSGSWKLYKDGKLKQEGTSKAGYTIRQGGTMALGQEQDSVGGDFDASQSFQGMLSNVNVWDHELDGTLIKERSKSCELKEGNEGNVYKWTDFLHKGGARLVHPSPCKIVELDYAFNFHEKGVNDVVKISGMRSLTDFTVCLWMRSSNPQGTLVSYAVGEGNNNDNELLIEYNRYFDFLIGGTKKQTSVTAFDGVWHHICLSRERNSGSWKFYKDGYLIEHGREFKNGYTIRQGGTLTLGQEQDSVGGGFDETQSFQGMLSNVNIWDHVLTNTPIEHMATSCLWGEGDAGKVYRWLDFIRQEGAPIVEPSPCKQLGKDYAFHFPEKGTNDVVKISDINSLTAFTVCLWMSSSNPQGTLLSYAVGEGNNNDNELLIKYNRYFDFLIGGTHRLTTVTANDGVWHHICLSWENSLGSWKFFKDGFVKQEDTSFKKGYTIRQGGTLVLGQEQDSIGGDFDASQSFQGMLSDVNVWDRVLLATQIEEMSQSCLPDERNEGNVYKWTDFLRQGGPKLVEPSPCQPLTSLDYAFHFPNKGIQDVVKISNMHSLTDFTVCIWMSSSNTQGTLLSYAVGKGNGNDNELLIEYNGRFDFLIGGTQSVVTSVTANDGEWHHICLSWERSSGSWKFYKDGDLEEKGDNFKKGYQIRQGGTLVLGQKQDSVGGDFDSSQSFQGMLSHVNLWDRVLPGVRIQEMSKSCGPDDQYDGNVCNWLDFLREGGPKLVESPTCKVEEMVSNGKQLSSEGDWELWNGHYYYHREKSAANSWFSAEGVCRQHGETVHLASIHSQRENDFIKSLSSDEGEQWIGLTDHNIRSNSFKWIDGSPYGDFTHWAVGEPNQATVDEDCGAMKPDGKWIDVACRKQRLGSDTPFDRRAFTCKTSGNTVSYQPLPSLKKEVKKEHDPAISVADLTSGGQAIKVTFFTGLHHIAPNGKFDNIAQKVQQGAHLKFGGYVDMEPRQLGPLYSQRRRDATHESPATVNDPDKDVSGVADLDGIVDKIEIPHYEAMNSMGSEASPGFSIEFWIRPRRMPVDETPMALFHKSSISLDLNLDGSLTFSLIINRESKLSCSTDVVADDTHRVRALAFHHIAVTGTVGSSLTIMVNGESACSKTTWGGITAPLPSATEGTLVFGENELHSKQRKRFNGQISNIQLFTTERTKQQIDRSIRDPQRPATGSIGFWSLRQSDELNVVHYVISKSQSVSSIKVLEDYDPPLTGFPLEVIVQGQTIYILRLTGANHVLARRFSLSADKRTLVPVPGNQRIIESSQAQKGCLGATRDEDRNHLILIECFAEEQFSGALRFKWNLFDINGQGQITPKNGGTGSLLVTGIGSLDTRLSAKIVNNHLLLTAGTTSSASIFFLDLALDSNGLPSISINELAAQAFGPEVTDNGATYYAYLAKESSTSSKPFLRRVRPQSGQVSNSYIINVRETNPNNLVANLISSNMPDNDWFWFLFKISTFNGGVAIQSGERINIQTPYSTADNEEGWSYVKLSCKTLQADQHAEELNFWIFKTESCDPKNGGYSVVSGEIQPNDCILIWPKTEQFEPGHYQQILALPTEREIESAKVRFGSWFGPWRLTIPDKPTPERPIPVPADSQPNSPRNVYQGNKYSLLHFNEKVMVDTPSSGSGVRGGLLRFAKTTVTPVIVSNNQSPALIKLIFRGNGGSFPLASFPHDKNAKLEVLFSTVYQEGSYAQRRMTSGLFYSVEYKSPSDTSSPGEFQKLARIGGLKSLEYPEPPTSFVWLIPPPFKVTGMCAAISTLFQFNDDTVNNVAPNSVESLTEVINNVVGPGSFGERLFKPLLSVHMDIHLLKEIGEQVNEILMRKIHDHIPKPPPASPPVRPTIGTHSWQELGDLEACLSLSNLTFWGNKVLKQKIKDKLKQVFRSKWMTEQIFKIRKQVTPHFLRDVSTRYSAYGGIAVLIANRLRTAQFLEELLSNDRSYIQPIMDSHLKVLDLIRPDLGIEVRQDIMSALLSKELVNEPWTIMQSLDKEKQREAISAAITAIYEDPSVPEEVRTTFTDVMKGMLNIILFPITSTQLGVFSNFLDMKKLDVLKAVDSRAKDFKERFLDLFVQEYSEDIAEINKAKKAYKNAYKNFNYLLKTPMVTIEDREKWVRNWRDFEKLTKLGLKRFRLRELFRNQLGKENEPLAEIPTNTLHKVIRNNRRFVTGIGNTFNVLGAVGATYSVFKEIFTPNSGFRQGNPRDVLSVVATAIGGVGSIKGTIDVAKLLKEKLFQRPTSKTESYVARSAVELDTFEEELATEFSVDLTNMERANTRLAQMSKAAKLGRFFTALGVVADGIFFGISIYDLYKDFTADNLDPWKIADDFVFAASSGIGAALGIVTFVGVTGAAAAATGIGALLVIGIGLIALISDAIRQSVRERQERERKCNEWKQWCSWGKDLFNYYGLLDSDADPCSTCPSNKKHHILRIMCSNRQLFPPPFKRALMNGLDSGKDVKSLVPSLGRIEGKTCPAWLRHFYKRQDKRRWKTTRN